MQVAGYAQYGGRHSESAAVKNLLAYYGVINPLTAQPFTEALCFGIAGGIGAGYSFCPSVPRSGMGSGVAAVGRYKIYATDAAWYQGFFDRIGAPTRITETTSPGKAYQNLVEELNADRPAVVWCSRPRLPFLGGTTESSGLWMHTFIVHAIDEAAGLAYGADRAPTHVTLSLKDLAEARNGICSHKNRTLTVDPPREVTPTVLEAAVHEGIRACVQDLLQPKMKTYSLPGLEIWAKMITNNTNKDGWRKVFKDGLMYLALRDVFDSIETGDTGVGLYRILYADFLDEAATVTRNEAFDELASQYLDLAARWTEFAEAALPSCVKPFKQTKDLLRKKAKLYLEEGEKAARPLAATVQKLQALETEMRTSFPLGEAETAKLLADLRDRLVALHKAEKDAALRLQKILLEPAAATGVPT